ncbi:hypothetical protein AAMO2058_001740000 [Amorphochlora amoebiformis]
MLEGSCLHIVVICLALSVGFLGYQNLSVNEVSKAEALWATVMKGEGIRHVPIEEWDENALREAVRGNKPVIFTPNPAVEWEVMQKWNMGYLASRLVDIARVQVSSDPSADTYTYEVREAPLAEVLPFESYDPKFTPTDMPAIEFFKCLLNYSDPRRLYYSGNLQQADGKIPSVILDIGDPKDLKLGEIVKSVGRLGGDESKDATIFVWMGKPGVKAHSHYDHVHNLFLQVSGYKRFVLIPPSNFSALKPYPHLHPRQGQSQIDIETTPLPSSVSNAMYFTMVEPGDLLYVPPLWTHHVTAFDSAMGPPISVSFWRAAPSEDVQKELWELALPLSSKWPLYLKTAGVYSFVLTLLATMDKSGHASKCAERLEKGDAPMISLGCLKTALDLLKDLRASRYSSLLEGKLVSEGARDYQCVLHPGEGLVKISAGGSVYEDLVELQHENLKAIKEKSLIAFKIVEKLLPEERVIIVFDYIEKVVLASVGISNLFDVLLKIPDVCVSKNITATHVIPPSA